MTHWYENPPKACAECGEPWNHPSHRRRCDGTFSGFGPGFSFCELEAEHDGPHLLHPWNGSEWLVDTAANTSVKTRPGRYDTEDQQ